MPHAATDWTAERVRALPDDGRRYEAVDGELLVTPAPRWAHQIAVGLLLQRLDRHARAHAVGVAVTSPADVELDRRSLVQPDVFVVRLADGRQPRGWTEVPGRLLLVAEVLSPSTARADRETKRRRYQRAGIPEYWIVNLDARVVERWRPEDTAPEVVDGRLEWIVGEAPALAIELPAFFAEVLDG